MSCTSFPNLCYYTIAQTARVTPLAIGMPGTGKSACVHAFSAVNGLWCYDCVGSLSQPTDFGVPFPTKRRIVSEAYKRAFETIPYPDPVTRQLTMLVPNWVHTFNELDCGVLFLDEITQCAPAQQPPVMRMIHDRKIGDTFLSKNVWILAACNPPECAANGSDFEPPLANRICHLQWETDYEGWERAMTTGAKFDPPRFVPLPDTWEEHLPKYSALVAAFHRHLPGRLEKYPTERSKVSGPWPSMRSWTNGAICMAALGAIDADPGQRYKALAGCVGADVALEYQQWEANLDLPDPEAWLALAADFRSRGDVLTLDVPDRGDKVMAVMAGVLDRVKNHSMDSTTGRISESRWLAGIDCCVTVAETAREVAMVTAAELLGAVRAKDASDKQGQQWFLHLISKVPSQFATECADLLKNIRSAK